MTSAGQPAVALTIAGSDSGAGAGIQADIKTMAGLGVLATTAITAVTAQNTAEVRAVHHVPAPMVVAQVRAVLEDLPVAAVKTGMLATGAVVRAIGSLAAEGTLPRLVVDPVVVASTGRLLLSGTGITAYRRNLLPHALVATPNLWEAAVLAGVDAEGIRGVDELADLAARIRRLGPTWVLVKGGHLPGVASGDGGATPDEVADVLSGDDRTVVFSRPHVDTANTHGTGCSLSAAIAAHLARGADVPAAVEAAKDDVHRALVGAAGWRLGAGHGPLDHLSGLLRSGEPHRA